MLLRSWSRDELNVGRIPCQSGTPCIISPLAVLAYAALAVLVTFPLVLNLPSRLPYDLGDPLLTAAILWWNAHVAPFTATWWDGFGFFPAAGSTAFSSDHLGASLVAAPLQWLGAGPVAAYNVVFLLSWVLTALAAHACALALTGRRDAAFVAGLAFGFNPQRVAHVEHLELLLAFGMPAALFALHRYQQTRRLAWAAVFGAALVIQAFSSSYYALFFTVFFALWLAWFFRPSEWRAAVPLVVAGAAAVAVLAPVYIGYSRIHDAYGMERLFEEVLTYSADVSSFVTASALSLLWGWTSPLNGGERQLFPGLTILVLAVAGIALLRRQRDANLPGRVATARRVCLALALLFALLAASVAVLGPWRLSLGPIGVSASDMFKPLSVALALALAALALSGTLRAAVRERSPLAFYLLAAMVLFLCSLGPEPTLLGRRILYEPPYAWLMRLPFFDDTVRVPARFGMLAVLALSLAASLAFARLAAAGPRAWLAPLVLLGIVADGVMRPLSLAALPAGFTLPREATVAATVLELPLGDILGDTAAMYRATLHGTRTVNGYNGYDPLYYRILRLALARRDTTVLDAIATHGPVLVAVNAAAPGHDGWQDLVSALPGAARLGDQPGWSFYLLPRHSPPAPARCAANPVGVAMAAFGGVPVDVRPLADRDPSTRWISPQPQREGDTFIVTLDREEPVCGIEISRGAEGELFPRGLEVATSLDGETWDVAFSGAMGGAAMTAVLDNPHDARIWINLPGARARVVRMRLLASDDVYQWAVAGLLVHAGTP